MAGVEKGHYFRRSTKRRSKMRRSVRRSSNWYDSSQQMLEELSKIGCEIETVFSNKEKSTGSSRKTQSLSFLMSAIKEQSLSIKELKHIIVLISLMIKYCLFILDFSLMLYLFCSSLGYK